MKTKYKILVVVASSLVVPFVIAFRAYMKQRDERLIFDAIKAYSRGELFINDPGEMFTNYDNFVVTNIVAKPTPAAFLTNEFGGVEYYRSNGSYYATPEHEALIKKMAEEGVKQMIEQWRSVGLWDSNGFVRMPHEEKMKRLKQLSDKLHQ